MAQLADMNSRTGASSGPARIRSSVIRPVLMIGGILALIIGIFVWWLDGGRVVSIDDAYVRAAKVTVATDVSGIVAQVAVHEGQAVHTGDVLFRLDDRPFRIALDGASAMRAQTVLDITAMKHDYQRLLHEAEARAAQVQGD